MIPDMKNCGACHTKFIRVAAGQPKDSATGGLEYEGLFIHSCCGNGWKYSGASIGLWKVMKEILISVNVMD